MMQKQQMLVAIPAPKMPKAGSPHLPKMKM